MISNLLASRKTVKEVEVATCLLNFDDETLETLGAPESVTTRDLVNFTTDVTNLQKAMLEFMDSVYECYETDDNAACPRSDTDEAATHQIWIDIREFYDKSAGDQPFH